MKKLSLTDKAGFVIIGNVLTRVNTFALLIILARMLSKDDYGTYSQLVMVGTLAYAFFSCSVSDSIYFFLPQLEGAQKKVFVLQTICILLMLGVIAGGTTWLMSDYLALKFNNPEIVRYLPVYSFYVVFWIANDYILHLLIASDRLRISVVVGFLDTLTNMLSMIIPVLLGKGLYYSFVSISIVAAIKFAIYVLFVMIDMRHIRFAPAKGLLLQQFKYFFPLTLSLWIEGVSSQVGKIIISLFYPPAIFAIYAVGSVRIPIWQVLTKSTNAVLRVKFTELSLSGDYEQILRIWAQSIRKLNLIVLPLVFMMLAGSRHFIDILFTAEYSESVTVFRILLFCYLFSGISTSLIPVSFGRTHIITIGSVLSILINLFFSVVLLKVLGYMGPAIATVMAYYVVSLYYLFKTRTMLGVTMSKLLPWSMIVKFLLINCASFVLAYPANMLGLGSVTTLLIICVVYTVSYLFIVNKSTLFNEDDKRTVMRWLKVDGVFSG